MMPIIYSISVLALVCLTIWSNNRIGKENRKLYEKTTRMCDKKNLFEQRLVHIETESPVYYATDVWPDKVVVYAVYRIGGNNLMARIKSYPYDPSDPESRDFARCNAEELVEILKREVV